MKLLIVESPAKAKTIEHYLDEIDSSSNFTVRASVGHVRDLPKSNKKAIDIPGGFIPHYEISPAKVDIINDLKALAKKATEVILATDPDREGEAISWHLKEALGLKKPKRIVFHEITKEAIAEALAHPRQIDENLRYAQEARRVLDRLVGYDLSGLIWKKVRYGLSAGRVQSPALRILVEREREIRAFIPETFYTLTAKMKTAKGVAIDFLCSTEPKTLEESDRILAASKKTKWKVGSVTESNMKRAARAPFTTSTLQQTASSRLGFSPSRTMQVAQRLYEAGHITYMRTDSTNLGVAVKKQIADIVTKQYGKEYSVANTFKTKSKNAQEAHEAIRPSHVEKRDVGGTPEQKKLYELIWERTIASQMKEATLLKTKIIAVADDKTIPEFSANGSRVIDEGWLKADPRARGEDVELPAMKEGEPLTLIDMTSEEKQTQPPGRYSEAGLVKELEKRGIGRPSTYASTIKTLQDRGYVIKEQRSLQPTDTGMVVSGFLEENFANYISDTFTAEMEDELDDIATGKREYVKTLKDFYEPFLKEVKLKSKEAGKITDIGPAPDEFTCPVCGGKMVFKLSRAGKFMSCAKFPECTGARMEDGREMEPPKETGEACPQCKDGKLMEREGRFGKFIACSNYPKCKFIKEDPAEAERKKTGVQCPTCKKGEMVERRGRFGIFYSCSNYPDCKNAIKAKPTGRICDLCGSLMMLGTKTIPERCSNKMCANHNPHKVGEKSEKSSTKKKAKK
jgi:DNA topoisomerase-1